MHKYFILSTGAEVQSVLNRVHSDSTFNKMSEFLV